MMIIGNRFTSGAFGLLLAASYILSIGATEKSALTLRRRAQETTSISTSSEEKKSLTVMTRNMYQGFNENNGAAVALAQFGNTKFAARVEALAAEINDTQPDLIGLQEVSKIILTGQNGITIDFLQTLLSLMSVRYDMSYESAMASTNYEFGPFPTGATSSATIKDRDVILVNTEVLKIVKAHTGRFSELSQVKLPDGTTAETPRSWQYADVTTLDNGTPFRFANAHLETSAPFNPDNEPVNFSQAKEFRREVILSLPKESGLIVAGDFNCVPSSRTYKLLTSVLDDAWDVNDDEDGLTCCQAEVLDNEGSENEARIDYILFRDSGNKDVKFDIVTTELVGAKTFQNEEPPYWVSDHAGVVSTLEF